MKVAYTYYVNQGQDAKTPYLKYRFLGVLYRMT